MKTLGILAAMSLLAMPLALHAQPATLDSMDHAPAGAVAIPLYGAKTPGKVSDEIETRIMGRETVIRNVTYPTLTPVRPAPGTANGTAVIVAPGGGFSMLAMQNEGWRVAQALAARGVTAYVLKYRLNPSDRDEKVWMAGMAKLFAGIDKGGRPPEITDPAATEDALAALKLVRTRAAEWAIDPHRVGMIGFSAGAITALNAVLQAPAGGAPDFFGFIYGPMQAVAVPAGAPPMFAALAMDDPLFGHGDFSIASAWFAAKRPVELHVYQRGGHGFGLGQPGTTSTLMMPEFLAWMDMQGLLTAKAKP
ncbi:alpha/beta hydrolase [Novosphingobium sp.]|uniref:alpha/beta hydrolase n=1 Tax=Novosphingobium sp. TaxID=1874826 RepID=UPI0025DF37DB|nr:alpha/beta hydrolase [Novosphingobium sp.]